MDCAKISQILRGDRFMNETGSYSGVDWCRYCAGTRGVAILRCYCIQMEWI